ncbi:MAG: alkaline phosphatase family protein [Oscillospiraceae bacterium]|nr:alkaline phosphatase family protein [Oscillospiraceae bacterium]
MKYLLVIGDGMADNPVPQLGDKTPLQYAVTPTMDKLASAGELGSVLTVPEGMPAGTDTAVLSIFGCDPRTYYTGRAPLEAAASGISLSPGDVAYRCNMVTFEGENGTAFEGKRIISHSAGSIEGEESDALIRELFETPVFKAAAEKAGMIVHPASSFRHIAVQKLADINGIVTAAPHDNLGEVIGPILPSGCDNAAALKALMQTAHEILDDHPINIKRRAEGKLPANGVWFWAEGTAVELPNFAEKYGKTGGVITAVPICHGIAALVGLEKIYVEGATGELHTNYEGKVAAALEVLRNHDFAAVHVEAPDECTHNGELDGKLQAIEWIDSRVLQPIIEGLAGIDFRMLFLSDHKTLISTRGHDGDPVPYIIYDSRFDQNTGLTYYESDAARGAYISDGTELMSRLFEQEVNA